MPTTALLASIGLLAAFAGSPALAGDDDAAKDQDRQRAADTRSGDGARSGMRVVPNPSGPDERSHGWRYFSDPAALRAVVISPQGDYYFSRGKGLRWVAGTPSGT
ncbi:hypothetical protein [Ramlibacter sp.]|uniref:hypothetical protein n=1 Tax=Ramlibacter sp. TaxID=1917967 RepID=UPI002D6214F7|nr:hypothetical protein [Ramlibacter sp.]HYD74627.1 hypothetical protein [Ramlibacter sp.]